MWANPNVQVGDITFSVAPRPLEPKVGHVFVVLVFNDLDTGTASATANDMVFNDLLWMDEILHHLETMVETIAYWYLQRNRIIPGFLNGGARWISSIHSSYGRFHGTVLVSKSLLRSVRFGQTLEISDGRFPPNVLRLTNGLFLRAQDAWETQKVSTWSLHGL